MRVNIYILTVLATVITVAARAQRSGIDSLLERFQQYQNAKKAENVYLSSDRTVYSPGDTIWIKGFVVSNKFKQPSDESKILYLNLRDTDSRIYAEEACILHSGFASAYMKLPVGVKPGVYEITAYTKWMLNYNPNALFKKIILAVGPAENFSEARKEQYKTALAAKKEKILEACPEGGTLVSNLPANYVFRYSYSGDSKLLGGKIVTQNGLQVAGIVASPEGIGTTRFVPHWGEHYLAVTSFSDNSTQTVSLGKPVKAGYTLQAKSELIDSMTIMLRSSSSLVNGPEMILIPFSHEKPLFYFKTKFPDTLVTLTVPKTRLPQGIIQWALFDAGFKKLAERLVFNAPAATGSIKLSGLKAVYSKNEFSHIELQANNAGNLPVVGSFAVSVTRDEGSLDVDYAENIITQVLLNNELAEKIPQVGDCVVGTGPEHLARLDQLLIANSLNGFDWQRFMSKDAEKFPFRRDSAFFLKGIVTDAQDRVVAGAKINLTIGNIINGNIADTTTNDKGQFSIAIPAELVQDKMRLQANYKSQKLRIKLDTLTTDDFIYLDQQSMQTDAKPVITARTQHKADSSIFNKGTLIKEVTIKGNPVKKLPAIKHSSNLNGPGQADVVVRRDVLDKMISINDIVILLPGTFWVGDDLFLRSSLGTHTPPLLVLIDGADGGSKALRNVNLRDIESIEFLKSPTYAGIYGIRGSGGVLIINTKQGDDLDVAGENRPNNVIEFTLPYQREKSYFQAVSTARNQRSAVRSNNSTIYWNSNVITDHTGKATFHFQNNCPPGSYKIVIEGISARGDLFNNTFHYVVK